MDAAPSAEPRPRPNPTEVRLMLVLGVGLGVTAASMGTLPALALVACAITLIGGALLVHVEVRRGHRVGLLLDDAGAAIATTATDDTNTSKALLVGAHAVLGTGDYWLLVEDGSSSRVLAHDGERTIQVPANELDRVLLDHLAAGARTPRGRGRGPFDRRLADVVAVRLPMIEDHTLLLCAGRREIWRWFSANQIDLLQRLAGHAALAMMQRRTVDRLHAESISHRRAASLDQLTGLVNRHQFRSMLSDALAADRRPAVMLIDLDRFKQVNDTMGHHNGDLLLAEMARRMREAIDTDALLARLGGDEFAVMVLGDTTEARLVDLSERLRAALQAPLQLDGAVVEVGASVGVAMCGWGEDDPGDLLRRADVAMYRAKGDRSGVEMYRNALDQGTVERLEMLPALRAAIATDGLQLHYQPQVDLATGDVVGAEGLVRWTTPAGQVVPAEVTVAIAEQADLIGDLTRWVVDRAVRDCLRWSNEVRPVRVSVNISARNLLDGDLAATVGDTLARHGLPGSALRLELTEGAATSRLDQTVALLHRLRALEVSVSLDDFGTGSSSLAHLASLPLDEVKIDQSLIVELGTSERAERVVRAMVELATSLGLDVVAEGVETTRQVGLLRSMGCRTGQGFHVSRPLPLREWVEWLVDRQRPSSSPTRSRTVTSDVVGTSWTSAKPA